MKNAMAIFVGLFLLLAQCLALASESEHDRLVNDLMRKSGLIRQISNLPEQMTAGLAQAQKQKNSLTPQQLDELEEMMRSSYNPSTLMTHIRQHMSSDLSSSDIKSVESRHNLHC